MAKMTNEERTARLQEKQRKIAEHRAAQETVTHFFESEDGEATWDQLTESIQQAIKLLVTPSVRQRKSSKVHQIKQLLLDNKTATDLELFQRFRVGPRMMMGYMRDWVAKAKDVDDRVWVFFDGENYVLRGTGENEPAGWDGHTSRGSSK